MNDKPEKTIEEIAQENGLKTISTTEGMNGYPLHIKQAIIGFENFEQAQELAKEYDLGIEIFKRRFGWDLWERTGNIACKPFERSVDEYGEGYDTWTNKEAQTFNETMLETIQSVIPNFKTLNELQHILDEVKNILEKIEDAGENDLIVTFCGEYHDTVEHHTMQYSYDSKEYAIGLIR